MPEQEAIQIANAYAAPFVLHIGLVLRLVEWPAEKATRTGTIQVRFESQQPIESLFSQQQQATASPIGRWYLVTGVESALIWPRKLGVSLVAAGAALISVWLVPTMYGTAMSHVMVAFFRAENSNNRVWDSARIRAYQKTLSTTFAPPRAVLRIPKLGVEVPVLEGTSDANLNRGVGHIRGTAEPGELGNLAITGHRDGFFRPLKDIAPRDVIEIERLAADGARHIDRYRVRDLKVVLPSDTSVLRPSSTSTLTLITCYPFYYVGSAPQRFVVQADLLPAPQTSAELATSTVQPFTGE